MRTIRRVVALAALTVSSGPLPALSDDVARGMTLVENNCARCHALTGAGESPHAGAPAFSTLSMRYPIGALEEAFVEGISTGHPDMPEFVATPEQIRAILAYLETLQPE